MIKLIFIYYCYFLLLYIKFNIQNSVLKGDLYNTKYQTLKAICDN